jgi:dihydrofolate synthase / folylpolyglutamate synthase
MTYQEILTHIYGLGRFGMKPGLERIHSLLNALSNPQDSLRVIHVAGTNGKGSTAAFLSAILTAAGHRVGLFTSPHLMAFPERIRINGREIPVQEVVPLAERVLSVALPGTTFFEIVTAMSFLYFAEQGVGPAIMEVGMGGRLDATNVAEGVLSLISPIALDHCEYLGDSIARITAEKAGVVKAGHPVAIARQHPDALMTISGICARLGSRVFRDGHDFSADWETDGLAYHGINWHLESLRPGIPGRYQTTNAALALCASELLDRQGLPVTVDAARKGMEQAFWPGRMEMFPGRPRVLLDGAHNPAGAEALAEALKDIPREALILMIGVVGDKDVNGILAPLLPHADGIIAVSPAVPRGLPSHELAERCRTFGHRTVDAGGVSAGLKIAFSNSSANDLVLVCGSLFTVGEARAQILARSFEPFRG